MTTSNAPSAIDQAETTLNMNKWLKKIVSSTEFTTFIVLMVLVVVTTIFNPHFLSAPNLIALARGMSFTLIAAIGVTLTILIGEIDISVGSVAGFGAVLVTTLATTGKLPLILAFLIAILCCSIMGTTDGVLVVRYKVPPFVATIAMLFIARSLAMVITQGWPIYPLPEIMNKIGLLQPLGISVPFVVAIVLIIIGDIVLRKTVLGRKLYAIGDNKEVARLAGINVNSIKILTFTTCGILAGFAGMLQAFQLQTGQPTIGVGWELTCIAACAIGGISLLGGSGSLIGTFLGASVMAVLNNALVMLKINTHWQNVVVGVIMVSAVLFDLTRRSRRSK